MGHTGRQGPISRERGVRFFGMGQPAPSSPARGSRGALAAPKGFRAFCAARCLSWHLSMCCIQFVGLVPPPRNPGLKGTQGDIVLPVREYNVPLCPLKIIDYKNNQTIN